MLFSQIKGNQLNYTRLAAICGTISFENKVNEAMRTVELFLKTVHNPVISAGFGKDSMATTLIARAVDPTLPIVCGDPPNPLSDREEHIKEAINFLGGKITRVPYDWDVESVLNQRERYPEGLKMQVLQRWQAEQKYDGVIMGVRKAESRKRAINYALRGEIYQVKDGTWRCLPISRFTAEESLATAIYFHAPINGVYQKTRLAKSFEDIRDGTWWPHGESDLWGYNEWIKLYYPEHYDDYCKAVLLGTSREKSKVCIY